jgi:hypothetical protein
VLGFDEYTAATWNNLLSGIVMVALAARSGFLAKQAHDAGVLPE